MFSGSKEIQKNFYKKGIMQLFSAGAIVFSKEKLIFFDPENMKKSPSKVAHGSRCS